MSLSSPRHCSKTLIHSCPRRDVIYWLPDGTYSDTDVPFFNFKRSLHWILPWTCLVWNLISHIPSIPNLEASHAINIRLMSMKLTRNTLKDHKFTHTKIISIQKDYHINFDVEQKRPLLLARSVFSLGTDRINTMEPFTRCHFQARFGNWWWEVNIGSGNGVVTSNIKQLSVLMLTQIYVAVWNH